MTNNQLLILFFKAPDPKLFLALSVMGLVMGLGLLVFAVYLILKNPEDLKNHSHLRNIKDSDWMQYFFGGLFFSFASAGGIISSYNGNIRTSSEIEDGLSLSFFIIAILSFGSIVLAKFIGKSSE